MTCLLCRKETDAGICSFHPGRLFQSFTEGPKADYRDAYVWSCCGAAVLSTVDDNGKDALPDVSPGCAIRQSHLKSAVIRVVHSAMLATEASGAANELRANGFVVITATIAHSSSIDPASTDCVIYLPVDADYSAAEIQSDALSTIAGGPWIALCSLRRGSERSRLHVATAKPDGADRPLSAVAVETAMQGVRMRHAPPVPAPFRIFLSYRRADLAIASAAHRFAICWWDKAVLSPGVEWATAISTAIESCQLFVLVVRDRPPAESYVWKELGLASRFGKPIAVLSFGEGGPAVLSKLGVAPHTKERGIVRWAGGEFELSCNPTRTLLSFSDLDRQLDIQLNEGSATRETYDTPASVRLFNFLREYPESLRAIGAA